MKHFGVTVRVTLGLSEVQDLSGFLVFVVAGSEISFWGMGTFVVANVALAFARVTTVTKVETVLMRLEDHDE